MFSLNNFLLKLLPVVIITCSSFIINGCGSSMSLISDWQDNQIKVDGDDSEWKNKLFFVSEYNTAIGFKNDDKWMYICISTYDSIQAMQILRRGFMVWIEPEQDDKTIGIKYPVHSVFNQDDPAIKARTFRPDMEKLSPVIKKMIEKQKELQIFNKDDFPLTLLPVEGNTEGIKAALGYKDLRFTYELQVPLKGNSSYKYGVYAEPGDKISISFKTEEPDRQNMARPGGGMGGMNPGEGMPGGQMPGGGRRDHPDKPRIMPPDPLDLTVEVTLQKN